jgi:hypothetical protein
MFDGARTFRFANGKLNVRVNMLKFKGHRAIKLQELPKPMTKVDAMVFLTEKEGVKAKLPTRSDKRGYVSPVQALANEKLGKKVARREKKAAMAEAQA